MLGNTIAIVGAGPAGLMAAETAARAGAAVTVYDRMPTPGRKLLMAGRGGLNLTHAEPMTRFLTRYGGARPWLGQLVEDFPPDALRTWSEGLGEPTFVGTSGRVFPRSLKASPLLRAWLARLGALGVVFRLRHRWTGWTADGALAFESAHGGVVSVRADATVLALGGASWPKLGADGDWAELLVGHGIGLSPLRPANCGFVVAWSDYFRNRFAGTPLKRIALSFRGDTVRGEAVITATGIEGGAVYALSAALRNAIDADGRAELKLDLRPAFTEAEIVGRLSTPRRKLSLPNFLRKTLKLPPVAIALLRENPAQTFPPSPEALAARIKGVPLVLSATAGIERAISTAGGIHADEIDGDLMLRRIPGVFVAGEMLDWEAPTGGYLLQACFATGRRAGAAAAAWAAKE